MEVNINEDVIKVMFITSNLRYGGAEKMIVTLANQLAKQVEKYDIIIHSYEDGLLNYKLDEKIEHNVNSERNNNLILKRFSQILSVRKTIKKYKPDIVISFLTNQNVFSILGTLFTDIPVIISERGNPYTNTSILYKFKYLMYNLSDYVVFQTKGAQEYFSKTIQRKSCIIENPVVRPEVYVNNKFNKRRNSISFVGRFETKQKRQDVMVKAYFEFRKLVDSEIVLDFYGDGGDMEEIITLSKNMGVYNDINFHGKTDNVIEKIADSKMYVLTSDYEGIPNSLIEAMSIGLPVISTKANPGGPELLINNHVNGILVEKENPIEIAQAMLFYLENPNIADEYGRKAREITEIFSIEEIISRWDYLINYVIKEKNR